MKSITSIKQSAIQEKWFLVDAKGQRIGIIASKVAELLMGKNNPLTKAYHKPSSHVIVLNAGKIDFTTKRGITKFYKSYSGYPDGLTQINLENTYALHPERPIENAVKGMLPRTKRGDMMIANLKIYVDDQHIHQAQQPEVINLKNFKV